MPSRMHPPGRRKCSMCMSGSADFRHSSGRGVDSESPEWWRSGIPMIADSGGSRDGSMSPADVFQPVSPAPAGRAAGAGPGWPVRRVRESRPVPVREFRPAAVLARRASVRGSGWAVVFARRASVRGSGGAAVFVRRASVRGSGGAAVFVRRMLLGRCRLDRGPVGRGVSGRVASGRWFGSAGGVRWVSPGQWLCCAGVPRRVPSGLRRCGCCSAGWGAVTDCGGSRWCGPVPGVGSARHGRVWLGGSAAGSSGAARPGLSRRVSRVGRVAGAGAGRGVE
ncbi:hypothetical protein BJ971_004984 [Actinoplanes digitatis]|uniref:Uncharacterized protein n=1 Tax=Actinoplanes digitatis TaxID=1868 RepID=A0A7W7I0X2_9ACTN|nr:hypothetical protein [Actinoplanes digitatis]